jgi:predicted metal-dependent phosphoesterase TrpH
MKSNKRLRLSLRSALLLLVLFVTVLGVVAIPAVAAGPNEATRWYRGSTHAHSFWSDGDDFPEMVCDWYQSHGYDFFTLSDHNCLMAGEKWLPVEHGERAVPLAVVEKCRQRFGNDWLEFRGDGDRRQVKLKTYDDLLAKFNEPGKFLLIQNEEITTKSKNDHQVHLNAINLSELIMPTSAETVLETLNANLVTVKEQARRLARPILAHVNHPTWPEYDISAEDLAAAAEADFFELCNAGPWGHHFGDENHPGDERMWDIANTLRIAKMKARPLYAIASDDAHRYHQFAETLPNPGRAWIMVRAAELSADALLGAMAHGDFYASTGVVLRGYTYDPKAKTVHIEVQSEPGVHYTVQFVGTPSGTDPTGEPVAADPNTKVKQPGRRYSPEIGKVFARVEGASASYQLTGNELYVRAVVRSDKPMANPPAGNVRTEEAWCQPVGWEK